MRRRPAVSGKPGEDCVYDTSDIKKNLKMHQTFEQHLERVWLDKA